MSNQSNVNTAAIMVALYDFQAEDEPEIGMKKGDLIEMLDMDPALNGWAYARLKKSGQEGYVPVSYLGTSAKPNKENKRNNVSRSSSPKPNTRFETKNDVNESMNNNRNYNHNRNSYQRGNYNDSSMNNNNHSNNNTNNSNTNNNNNNSSNNNNQNNNTHDTKQIICSFHRDFIPEIDDLYKYFQIFGKVTNKIDIEYDPKKVPLAKIKFQNASSVEKVCDKGNRQQIPSGAQNGTIHIRVYRSMQDYINNTQRSNRGAYKKHPNSRRGGGF